ncbi:MAG: hypothetical protein U0175_08845 [Caldilineaceae bacterium]
MITNSTSVLQRYLLGILVTLGVNRQRFAVLASTFYAWGEGVDMSKVTTRVARLLVCSGSGEASRPLCQPMRFSQLRATA